MIVLGINDGHDSGVCLLQDGRVLMCSSEERRINVKNVAGVPAQSIDTVIRRTGIQPKDVDLVTLTSMIRTVVPTHKPRPSLRLLQMLWSAGRTEWGTQLGRWMLPKFRKMRELKKCLADRGMGETPILPLDHHLCHAATAYFHRPWVEPATVLTLDGAGDGICATVCSGQGMNLYVHSMTPKFHSPAAWMYSAITAHLGLKPYEHEYKVMGMAPYGQPDYCIEVMRQAFAVEGLQFRNKTGRIGEAVQRWFHSKLYKQRFDNVSAACQQLFEEMVVEWARNAIQATGLKKVTAAGGAFLNVKANKLIREMPEVESLYVYPASDDGGTPVGAAILGYLRLCEQKGVEPQLDLPKTMYLGMEYTEGEMEAAAKTSGLPCHRMSNPADEIGEMLAEGKIVARFNGQEELGPRALGNRSILADPRDLRFIRKLNFAIKQRDFWMPFAASVLEEDAPRYIKNISGWAFYMIEAFDATPEGVDKLVAGTHPFDRTIRPQIVNELNPSYRDVIRAFKARTGVGGLLNTSLNLHGSPIVGTPEVALDTLKKSELDALALGPFLVTKPEGNGKPADWDLQ
jgi:carbamoyltransferase